MNTIDYQNNALIFGNGGRGNWNGGDQNNPGVGKFYIINNFIAKFNEHYQANTVLTLADAIEVSCDYYNFTGCSKFNVLFGEVNIERYRNQVRDIAYIVCSTLGKNLYNTKIFRIQLGIGSNRLDYGAFQTVDGSEYNGTYNVLDTYVGLSDGTDYPNDITFIDGNLYACVGENGVRYQKFVLDNVTKRIIKCERKQRMYNPDGAVVGTTAKNRWSSGIGCLNDKVATTFSNTGGMFLFDKNAFK